MRLTATLTFLFYIVFSFQSFAAETDSIPRVADLAWMTGKWSGPIGQQTLEEHWIDPTAGSIAAIVRSTGSSKTNMVEMILIEEEGDSLVLRVQQWNPGYKARTPGPQTMKLVSSSARSVKFEDVSGGSLKSLAYSRPTDSTFRIEISTSTGSAFTLNLKAI